MHFFSEKLPKTLGITISNNSLKFESCMLHREVKTLVQDVIDAADKRYTENVINFKCNFRENDDYVSLVTFIPNHVFIEEKDVVERFYEVLGIKAFVYLMANGQRMTATINKEGYRKICKMFLENNPNISLASLKDVHVYRLPLLELRINGCVLKFKEHLKLCYLCLNTHDEFTASFCRKTCMVCGEPNEKEHECVAPGYCVPCKVYLQKKTVHPKSECYHLINLQNKLDVDYRQKFILEILKDQDKDAPKAEVPGNGDFPNLSKKNSSSDSNVPDVISSEESVTSETSETSVTSESSESGISESSKTSEESEVSESSKTSEESEVSEESEFSKASEDSSVPEPTNDLDGQKAFNQIPVPTIPIPYVFPQPNCVPQDSNIVSIHIPKAYLAQGMEVTIKMRDGLVIVSQLNNITYL